MGSRRDPRCDGELLLGVGADDWVLRGVGGGGVDGGAGEGQGGGGEGEGSVNC